MMKITNMKNLLDILIIFGAKYLVFVAVAIVILQFITATHETKKKIIIFSAVVLPLSYIVAKISSYFYYDARPFVIDNFVPLIPHDADNGFPSDHTLLGAAIAAVTFCFDKKKGALLFFLAILVGGSRVLAGVHHSIDIVGSIVIVSLVSLLGYKFLFPIMQAKMK